VVVFVELRLADLFFHVHEIGAMRSSRAMLFTTANAVVTKTILV
jgi:hypothetical protein